MRHKINLILSYLILSYYRCIYASLGLNEFATIRDPSLLNCASHSVIILCLGSTILLEYNHKFHDIGTRSHDWLYLYPTRTGGIRNVLRHHILNSFPKYLINKIKTHSLYSKSHHIKCYLIYWYSNDCNIIDCNICNNTGEWQTAQVETLTQWPICDRLPRSG